MTEGAMTPGGGWRRADGPAAHEREKRRRRKGNGTGTGHRPMAGDGSPQVDDAEFTSYYGRPILKSPTWKTPDVPLYLFLGGAAGTSAVIGAVSEFTDRPGMAKVAHLTAGTGALASVAFLIHDLGRPARFLHMLRVFKPTSPLSVGSYILSPFSALTVASAGLHVLGRFPGLRTAAAVGAAVFGGPMTTYTAVLFSNTAVPAWHEAHEAMPILFAGSAMAAGGGITMALSPLDESGPAQKVALVGAAVELAASRKVEHGHGIVDEPFHQGTAGVLLKAAKACTAGGAGVGLLARRSRVAAVASGTLLAVGSALTRFGIFEAGMASSRDPKYVVVPQRERIAARAQQNGHASTITR